MTTSIKETIDTIIVKHFGFQSRIDLPGFTSLLKELQTLDKDLELTEEVISEIFTLLHPDENGLVSSNEVEKLVDTIIPIYAEKKETRGSIFYDKDALRFTYSPNIVTNHSPTGPEKNKIASDVLNNLSLVKLSDLKFIYHAADKNNRKFVEYDKLLRIANDLKVHLSISELEIKAIFSTIRDAETNQVSFELLSELISKLEKEIFNCYNDTDEPEPASGKKRLTSNNNNNDLVLVENVDDPMEESTMAESPKSLILKIREEVLKIMSSKLSEINSLSIKLKNQRLDDVTTDLKKYLEELDRRLLMVEVSTDKFLKTHEMILSTEDLQITKMKALESDLRKQRNINEMVEEENTNIYKRLDENADSIERLRILTETQRNDNLKLEEENAKILKEKKQRETQIEQLEKKLEFANENYNQLKIMISKAAQQRKESQEKSKDVKTNELGEEEKTPQEEAEYEELKLILATKEEEISRLRFENSTLAKQLQEFQNNEEDNDRIILNLKAEIAKMKDLEVSGFNRPSQFNSSFVGQNNLRKQLKLTTDAPSSIFNARISNMKSRLSRISKLNKLQSFNINDNEERKLEKLESFGGLERIEENKENVFVEKLKVPALPKEEIEQNPVEYKYLYFNEASLFAKDYLGIREDPVILNMLMGNDEERKDLECFSDYINRLFLLENKKKLAIFVSNRNMYFLDPKRYKIVRKIPLPSIKQIVISEKSAILLGIKVRNDVDDLIECFRRADLILYLMQVFKAQNYPMFERVFEKDYFNIKVKGKVFYPNKNPEILKKFNPEIQQVYRSALKIGFLAIFKAETLFFSSWKECFFLLTNVGLVSFKREGDVKPIHFIPILGCLLDENPIEKDKSFCFKIYYVESPHEILLAAKSEAEKNEWLHMFKEMKKKESLEEKKF